MTELTIRPEEIRDAIERNVAAYSPSTAREEVGRVTEIGDGIARVEGLHSAMTNELLEFEGGLLGVALNLDVREIGVVLLGDGAHIEEGQPVRRTGWPSSMWEPSPRSTTPISRTSRLSARPSRPPSNSSSSLVIAECRPSTRAMPSPVSMTRPTSSRAVAGEYAATFRSIASRISSGRIVSSVMVALLLRPPGWAGGLVAVATGRRGWRVGLGRAWWRRCRR